MCSQTYPTHEDLHSLMEELRPQISALFEARGVSEGEAGRLVGEIMIEIIYRWSRIRDRAGWVLKTLDKRTRPRPEEPKEESAP